MSNNSYFEIEDEDIVRLVPYDSDTVQTGWVNVGPFAVCLRHSPGLRLMVEIHPRGAESGEGIARCNLSHHRAIEEGGTDYDKEDQ